MKFDMLSTNSHGHHRSTVFEILLKAEQVSAGYREIEAAVTDTSDELLAEGPGTTQYQRLRRCA
ncbi:MAG TPA: hypothetical protein VG032_03670 [Acidimicrobiales bacterium]|nr:hypothetical protein [Acidimicrobiales bacterium]